MTVKINVLARSTEPTKGYKDTKTYDMGMNADGTANTSTATEDQYKRHVFQSLAALPNPAGRRAK
jgi:type IV pilus assembly protein PilW